MNLFSKIIQVFYQHAGRAYLKTCDFQTIFKEYNADEFSDVTLFKILKKFPNIFIRVSYPPKLLPSSGLFNQSYNLIIKSQNYYYNRRSL